MGLLLKRSAKTRKGFIANSLVLSKQFDLGDPTMFKKYSQCSITYKIKGSGVSPVRVRYKVDNEQYWQTFENEIRNSYGLDSHLKKTGNENRTAQFKFKNNSAVYFPSWVKHHCTEIESDATRYSVAQFVSIR